jgi:hypothetical protein
MVMDIQTDRFGADFSSTSHPNAINEEMHRECLEAAEGKTVI